MSLRRGSLKLKAFGKSHGSLHMLLWQAREVQSTLLAAAAAQKTLFSDIAAWASTENRALSDVCSCASELSTLCSGALTQLALAFKSFRKEMSLVLEGEKRCDSTQKMLQDAEQKRIKLRRQVLRSQNRTINEGTRQAGDYTQLQAQLAEAERNAERAHVEACDASREQEAVKLVVLRAALGKLSQSHITMSSQMKVIFDGNLELANLLPEPPPPGDPLSCIRYTSYDTSKAIVERVKRTANVDVTGSSTSSRRSSAGSSRPLSTSTPVTSPNSSMWSAEPSAPRGRDVYSPTEPPPPYNTSYLSASSSPNQVISPHSRSSMSHSPHRAGCSHVTSANYCNGRSNSSSISPNSSVNQSLDGVVIGDENRSYYRDYVHLGHQRNASSVSMNLFREQGNNLNVGTRNGQSHSYSNLPSSSPS